jgi:hypothetical protein
MKRRQLLRTADDCENELRKIERDLAELEDREESIRSSLSDRRTGGNRDTQIAIDAFGCEVN